MGLTEATERARQTSRHRDGKCSMCAAGDEPENGLHRKQYRCGNEGTCSLCNNAGMEHGDQCAACGRIEKHDYPACAIFRGGKCTCDVDVTANG